MSFGEAAFKLLKEQLLPEIGQMKQELKTTNEELGGVKVTFGALINRLDSMERESIRRFELIDGRFEQIDKRFELIDERFEQIDKRLEQIDKRFELLEKRIEDQGAEHFRRMDLLDKRMERLEVTVSGHTDRLIQLTEAIGKLSLLGDYVKRVDEIAGDVREVRRRQDELERRLGEGQSPRASVPRARGGRQRR